MLVWTTDQNLYLSGFMASGKTTAARRLAAALRLPWYDTDKLIEQRLGLSIPEIFERHGEPFFRQVEHEVVQEIVQQGPAVVSLGGGVVLDSESVSSLKRTGKIICILPSAEVLWQRLRGKTNRPLLLAENEDQQKQKLLDLYDKRAPIYRQVADLMLEPQKERHPAVTVHEILTWLRENGWVKLSE